MTTLSGLAALGTEMIFGAAMGSIVIIAAMVLLALVLRLTHRGAWRYRVVSDFERAVEGESRMKYKTRERIDRYIVNALLFLWVLGALLALVVNFGAALVGLR
jgi:hypothetical protein